MHYIGLYLEELYYLTLEMAPWLLLGFIFAGLLHVFMPGGSIRRWMGGRNIKSVLYAALLGIPLPLCSCGVIPTGISFYKEGASRGSTVSFLISTPQTGVDSILATYSLMGLPFAVLRPVVAFFSGILGGWITNLDGHKRESDPPVLSEKSQENLNWFQKIQELFRYAFIEFLMDIAFWLVIGLAVAALISVLLPQDFFNMYLHNELLSVLVMLAASIPIYVCATGSIPVAAVLLMKGLSPGAALVFLMAGPATNTATMAVIGKAIGRRTLVTYLLTIIGSAILFGILTDMLLPRELFTSMVSIHEGHEHGLLPYWIKIVSASLLVLLIINGYIRKFLKNQSGMKTNRSVRSNQIHIGVGGMTCSHCKMNVEKNLSQLQGVNSVEAFPDKEEVIVSGQNLDLSRIISTIEGIGYSYKGEKQ